MLHTNTSVLWQIFDIAGDSATGWKKGVHKPLDDGFLFLLGGIRNLSGDARNRDSVPAPGGPGRRTPQEPAASAL